MDSFSHFSVAKEDHTLCFESYFISSSYEFGKCALDIASYLAMDNIVYYLGVLHLPSNCLFFCLFLSLVNKPKFPQTSKKPEFIGEKEALSLNKNKYTNCLFSFDLHES